MAKTKNKKNETKYQLYKKGHVPCNKGGQVTRKGLRDSETKCTVRLDRKMYDEVFDAPVSSPVNDSSAYRFLRPRPKAAQPTSR